MTETDTAPPTKRCVKCGKTKPRNADHFSKRPDAVDGLRADCADCENARRRARTAQRAAMLVAAAQGRPLPPASRPRPSPPPSPVPAPVPRSAIGDDEDTEEIDASAVARPPTILPTIEPTRAERYVITYAQNATPAHLGFLASLKTYCEARDARLVVIPGRYRNPTSVWTQGQEHDEWWAAELAPYLFAGRMQIGRLVVYGDISIQPTAVRPVSSFEVFAGQNSAVFGHTKIEYRTIPSNTRYYPRILTSTGACTVPNYVAAKAGKKGEAHHTLGACVVERDPRLFHIRQIYADEDGVFTDLDRIYTPDGVRVAPRPEALMTADIHEIKMDPVVDMATFRGPESICGVLHPKRIIYHDLLDFDTRNHHTRDDFQNRYERASGRANDFVRYELDRAIDYIDRTPEDAEPIIVRSNHDAAFDRWLKEADWKADPVNARVFIDTWSAMLDDFDQTGVWPDAFELYYRRRGKGRAKFLRDDDSFVIGGVEYGQHGHIGINGARGSLQSLSKLGTKISFGHVHSPGIWDGAMAGGVGGLDQKYNRRGFSSWLSTHIVHYDSGARTLVTVVDGRWRAD